MKGSTYILTAAALMTVAAALQNGQNYVAHLPAIVQNLGQQIETCENSALNLTVTQRIACVRNVSFADVRKMDMRADNRRRSNGGALTIAARK